MRTARHNIAAHLALIVGMGALLVLCVVYPFLAGRYDSLAVPLSTMAQVFGLVGLPLVLVGVLWLLMPRRGFTFAIVSLAVGTGVALLLALLATLSVGNAFGILTLATWACIVLQLMPRLKRFRGAEGGAFHPAPLYLVALPVLTLVSQVVLAAPMTRWSRDRAIASAREFIGDIEQYHAQHGRYPLSLQAQNKDYDPGVVGVDKFLYSPQGDGYDLSFEQPRFLLDRFGTREWVVYNPRDEHRAYSHTAWLLLPAEGLDLRQGWYASGETRHAHWKYFWFD